MPVLVPEDYAHCTLHFEHPSYEGEACITFGLDLRTLIGSESEVAAGVGNAFIDTVMTRMSGQVILVMVTVRIHHAAGDVTVEAPFTSGGLLSDTLAPPQCAYLVQKRTGLAGKKNRGRFYLPGVMIGSLTANRPDLFSSGPRALLENELALFLVALTDMSAFMVILHDEMVAGPPTPVTSLNTVERLATQRGRLRD